MAHCSQCGDALQGQLAAACAHCGMFTSVPPPIAERARDFVGRDTPLQDLDAWLQGDRPIRILTGEPGVGKSAFMAWLAGAGPPPKGAAAAGARNRIRQHLAAAHFCFAKRSRTAESLDPREFANSLIRQFSVNIDGYADLLASGVDRNIHIEVHQDVSGSGSQEIIGVQVQLHTTDSASLFRSVLEPFSKLDQDKTWVVLVDALDEAELWTAPPRIASLLAEVDDLPSQLRVLASTRPKPMVLNLFDPGDIVDLPPAADDVKDYARQRSSESTAPMVASIIGRIVDASQGNFLFAKTALDYWLPRAAEVRELRDIVIPLTPELGGLYQTFLQREYGDAEGRQNWKTTVRPLFGALGTAQQRFDRERIRLVLDSDADSVGDALRQGLPYLAGDLPDGPFDLYHESFREYIFDAQVNQNFSIDEATAHATTASAYIDKFSGKWGDCIDNYGLAFTPTHLAEAAETSSPVDQHDRTKALVDLVTNEDFVQTRHLRLNDVVRLEQDFVRTLQVACLDAVPGGLRLIARAAQAFTASREIWRNPDLVFAAAEQGDLKLAQRRLNVLQPERRWAQATSLLLAWVAGSADPDGARDLVDRVAGQIGDEERLIRLVERVREALSPSPRDHLHYPLEGDDRQEVARAILDRMRGTGNAEVLAGYSGAGPLAVSYPMAGVSQISPADDREADVELMSNTTYLGGVDGPHLVAHAVTAPMLGDAAIDEYLALLSANGYIIYRNRSLWAFFNALLAHPDQAWVLRYSKMLTTGALAGSSVAFSECQAIARLGLAASAGAVSNPTLDRFEAWATQSAEELAGFGYVGEGRGVFGTGDTWSYHKRRLGAIAETHAIASGLSSRAEPLLRQALDLHRGYAGFQSPACVSLAESWLICDSSRNEEIESALNTAFTAAHCVQDPPFCARTTSRFNAIARLWGWTIWWGGSEKGTPIVDLGPLVERFVQNPFAAEFSAAHWVGEPYEGREEPEVHLPFPDWARSANTLEELARLYDRPLADFQKLNPDIAGARQAISEGEFVNVPDPGFTPHLAGALSAQLVADQTLTDNDRIALLRMLVPVSTGSTTNFDRVLSRLMLVGGRHDPGIFTDLPTTLPERPDPVGFGREMLWAPWAPGAVGGVG